MDQDPYQPDESGVTDEYSGEHRWWHPLAWVVGGRIAGNYDAAYHPRRHRILSIVIGVVIVALVIGLIIMAKTDPRNTPLPVPPNN
jgi:hypothetical protein